MPIDADWMVSYARYLTDKRQVDIDMAKAKKQEMKIWGPMLQPNSKIGKVISNPVTLGLLGSAPEAVRDDYMEKLLKYKRYGHKRRVTYRRRRYY